MEINLKNNFLIGECIHGFMIWPMGDGVLGPCLKNYGEWSEGENIIMSQFINKGDTVIDIGANIGTTVLSLSKQVGENGQVLAFEPQNHIAQCLNTNLTINGITNVIVDNAAISKKCGWAKINDKEFEESGRYGEAGISKDGTTKIRTINLDEIELDRCSLIKIDIEGHEWDAIQGGKNFLKKHKPVLYMEAKKDQVGTKKFLKWFFDNGWICYWHYAIWFRENNYKNNKKCIHDPGLGDMNIVAVPRDKKQPTNLLKLKNYNEEWDGDRLINFYSSNQIPMI
jgi:FkbM family methyltransferase